jgi:hypothetical protein
MKPAQSIFDLLREHHRQNPPAWLAKTRGRPSSRNVSSPSPGSPPRSYSHDPDLDRCLDFVTGKEETLDNFLSCYGSEGEPDEDKLYAELSALWRMPRQPDAGRYYADDGDGEYAEIAAALGIRRPASLEPR